MFFSGFCFFVVYEGDWYNICCTVELPHYMLKSRRVWKAEPRLRAAYNSLKRYLPWFTYGRFPELGIPNTPICRKGNSAT